MYYFGTLKNNRMTEVFYSKNKPTKQNYGHLYNYVTGGYKTKLEAIQQANSTGHGQIVFFDGRKRECRTKRNLCLIAGIIA
jgi:hypothetical protein